MKIAKTYKDRANSFVITMTKGGSVLTAEEMAAITKIEIKFDGEYYDSVAHPTGFEKDDASGQIIVRPVNMSIPTGKDTEAELIIYDADEYSSGFVWTTFKWLHSADAALAE